MPTVIKSGLTESDTVRPDNRPVSGWRILFALGVIFATQPVRIDRSFIDWCVFLQICKTMTALNYWNLYTSWQLAAPCVIVKREKKGERERKEKKKEKEAAAKRGFLLLLCVCVCCCFYWDTTCFENIGFANKLGYLIITVFTLLLVSVKQLVSGKHYI